MPFKPGNDPNRYQAVGLGEWRKEVSDQIRTHIPECIEFILTTIRNEKAHPKLRLTAVQELMNRGLGKPVDTTMIISLDPAEDTRDVQTLTDSQLESLVHTLSNKHEKELSIDGEYTEVSNDGG